MSFLEEVHQQPSALRDFIGSYIKDGKGEEIREFLTKNKGFEKVVLTGMGSSYFAALSAALYLVQNGVNAEAVDSGELVRNRMALLNKGTLIIAVSQTANSPEVLELAEAVSKKFPMIAVTNNKERKLSGFTDITVEITAGQELFTSTKTYTNTIAALYVICCYILDKDINQMHLEMEEAAKQMETILKNDNADKVGQFLEDIENICYIGSAYGYFTATNTELITSESAKIFGSRYTTGQFLHGPVEMINEKIGYFIFDSNEATRDKSKKIMDVVLKAGGKVVHFTSETAISTDSRYLHCIVPKVGEMYSPIVDIVLVELIINNLSIRRGYTPGSLNFVQK